MDPPVCLTPKSTSFSDFHPLEVARQLTLLEFMLYSKIKPAELLGKGWSKPERNVTSPNVVALTTHFNSISMWVATSIVKEEGVKERALLIKKFIKIALVNFFVFAFFVFCLIPFFFVFFWWLHLLALQKLE